MNKFIQKAEELISTWQELKDSSPEGVMLFQINKDKYEDAVIDTRIVISEFGCQPIIEKMEQHRLFPNPADSIRLLHKVIEAASLRSKENC